MNSEQKCTGIACGNPARLQCPTCLKNGISGSYFCTQECFKKNWATHKPIHDKGNTYIPKYNYTGSLRAVYPLSPRRPVPPHIIRPDYADDFTGQPKSEQSVRNSTTIKVLNEEEIEGMRTVCKLAREVLDIAAAAIKPGVTTDELDRIVHEATIERDSYPSPLNYYGFPKSVCTSVNEGKFEARVFLAAGRHLLNQFHLSSVICHGIPDQRELQDGDIVNVDVTLYHNGFHGDLNEIYPVGNIDEDSKRLLRTAKECLDKAIEHVKPGFLYRNLGAIIEKTAKENNCSVVSSYCGHGIHRLFHCAPSVPHYKKNKAVGIMKPGHVFTIEPMINLGTWKDQLWPDNWTAVTVDGKRSAQFEHTLLVTETGVEVLTARANEKRIYP
ncbi:944_t:CDS:10 [Paraglomus occultum]|uniref:Methionine aminopeptidase n=1 Tax=Paraglomus occultum TaxID=144539 RepID=A0A9N9AE67_9GLOM|nr:944_t:CDS:10 [Paraglomus occultum]